MNDTPNPPTPGGTPPQAQPAMAPVVHVSDGGNGRKRKLVGGTLLVLIIALLGGLAYLWMAEQEQYRLMPQTPEPGASLYKASRYSCSTSGAAVLCQDVRDGSTRKYELPASLGVVSAIYPSPDGSRFAVQTAPDPLYDRDPGHVFVTDTGFKVVHELPADNKAAFVSLTWTDGNSRLALARRTIESGSTQVSLYDITAKQERPVGQPTSNSVVVYPSADGAFVFIEERAGDKPVLTALQLSSGQSKAIETAALLEHMESYATSGYDDTANTFYISGSSKNGSPIMVVAQIEPGDEKLGFSIRRVINDGYAYVPLRVTEQGMLVQRQKDGDPTRAYGFVTGDQAFKPSAVRPQPVAAFGMAKELELQAADKADITADDYYYSRTEAPESLTALLRPLVTATACPSDAPRPFNRVGILAHDDTLAVAQITPCTSPVAELHYYRKSGASYNEIGTSLGIPHCSVKGTLGLNDIVAPSCIGH